MRWLAFIPCVVVAACTFGTTNWQSLTTVEKQEATTAISRKCNLLANPFQIVSANQIHFRPDPKEKYQAVDCALSELKRFHGYRLGFIGNEAYIGNTQ